ncbi:hypothetical protein [Shewanella japonica]|uniref:Uncharacterized protein n=1 Tax=Shewanella japonica TaxID=93973 RepID=A0ABN4YAB2_9GAMM|nr:hypothetical protein [Shewanella japonica]ARD20855.1 hypothetical protein SJ2017_0517 [Shewanella japonica]
MKSTPTISLILITIAFPLHAYELGKKSVENLNKPSFSTDSLLGLEWQRNHERLTAMSLQCLADANRNNASLENKPTDCSYLDSSNMDFEIFKQQDSKSEIQKYFQLLRTVRWPDDPTRQIYLSDKSSAKFAVTVKEICSGRIEDDIDNKIVLPRDGILCTSHYGSLQFLHAMAEKDGEEHRVTQELMETWSRFAFDLSKGTIDLTDNYHKFWIKNDAYQPLVQVMQADKIKEWGWHKDRDIPAYLYIFNWDLFDDPDGTFNAWTLGSLFSMECDAATQSSTCGQIEDENEIRLSALGSIIHMIQDSYSNSHTNRSTFGAKPTISCSPITQFYSYTNQSSDTHSESDKWPDFECGDNPITLDPVTAAAQVIWLHNNPTSRGEDVQDIIKKVISHPGIARSSGSGTSYKKI